MTKDELFNIVDKLVLSQTKRQELKTAIDKYLTKNDVKSVLPRFREWAAENYGEGYHDMVWEEWEKYHVANVVETDKAERILEKHINEDDLNFIFHEKNGLWHELLNAVTEALLIKKSTTE